jgi:hypothetical protein
MVHEAVPRVEKNFENDYGADKLVEKSVGSREVGCYLGK